MQMMSKDEAFELSKSIGNRAANLQRDIQKIAATAIGYANVHGDVTVAQNIMDNIRDKKGIRLNSLVKYIETHAQLAWDKESKNFVYHKREDVITDPLELFMILSENKWYEAIKQEVPQSVYDVQEMLKNFIEKCERLANKGTNTVKHTELIDQLKMFTDPNIEIVVTGE